MAKENTPNQNSDDNAPNEKSQKFDRPEVTHPRVNDETLKQSDHYVSLEKIKQSERTSGTGTNKTVVSKDKPEPTPEVENVTPGAREMKRNESDVGPVGYDKINYGGG